MNNEDIRRQMLEERMKFAKHSLISNKEQLAKVIASKVSNISRLLGIADVPKDLSPVVMLTLLEAAAYRIVELSNILSELLSPEQNEKYFRAIDERKEEPSQTPLDES